MTDMIQLTGRITETGELELTLPPGLTSGEVDIIIAYREPAWSEEQLDHMLTVEPKSGAEIVARLEEGWEQHDINDGAEWVAAQRTRRREHRSW